MTDTTVGTNVEVTNWENSYYSEYIRTNEFAEVMGTGATSVVVLKEQLMNLRGLRITIPLVGALSNSAVTGDSTLQGNEEALDNYGHEILCTYRRNAVRVGLEEQGKSAIELLNAAREMLMGWSLDDLRDRIVTALFSIDGTAYASASEAARDTWQAANSDRVLFGASVGNATGDQSVDMAKVDSTNDKLTTSVVSLAKRIAKSASPAIRPFRVRDMQREEWFMLYANPLAFRDFKADIIANTGSNNAIYHNRGANHPVLRDGDIVHDGVIVREVPAIGVLSGVGASSIDVAPCALVGAQAVGMGIKERSRAISDMFDYDQLRGVGVRENTGVEKLQSNFGTLKDHGVVTVYVSGVADA